MRKYHGLTRKGLTGLAAIAALALGELVQAQVPRYSRVVVVIFENHSYAQIIGNPQAPNFNALGAHGANFLPAPNDPTGVMSGSHAVRHPSQPNYLEFYSGNNQGTIQDGRPGTQDEPFTTALPFTTPNLGAALRSAG
jgi:hypothetical protein